MAKKKKVAVDPAIEEIVRSVGHTCRGPLPDDTRVNVVRLLAEGNAEEARRLDDANRPGCGYDFNETILNNPLDGNIREYECPGCGVTGEYKAPIFDE